MTKLTVNGKALEIDAEPDTPPLWVLRSAQGRRSLDFAYASLAL